MTKSFSLTLLAFLFVGMLLSFDSTGQRLFSTRNKLNRYSSVGFGLGSAHYYGDLSSPRSFYYGFYTNVRWNINANYTRHLNPNTAIRLQLAWIRILGDDFSYAQRNIDRFWINYIRNLNFRNDIKELTLSGIFNLIPAYGKGSRDRLKFTPYLTAGVGLIAHSPKATIPIGLPDAGKWTALKKLATNGNVITGSTTKSYSLISAVLPLGLGFRYKLNPRIDISLEGNLRITSTRYLDDVARDPYPNETNLTGKVGPKGTVSYRADETIESRKGQDRIPTLTDIYSNKISGTYTSINDINTFYNTPGRLRSSYRFNDMYFTTQVTISYLISDLIKCPIPK